MFLLAIKLNSIQDYIFSSNILKENIGASHITNHVLFSIILRDILEKEFSNPGELAFENWMESTGRFQLAENNTCKCEVLEIGGGGILILFQDIPDIIIRSFSRKVMEEFPGLKFSVAIIKDFDADQAMFRKQMDTIHKMLEEQNKGGFYTTLPVKWGIMANCQVSQYAAEFPYEKAKGLALEISGFSKSKIDHAIQKKGDPSLKDEKYADNYYSNILNNDRFRFTTEIEKLVNDNEAGYIAVVHIDGNGIGKKIRGIESLAELQNFSTRRRRLVRTALENILQKEIIGKIDENGKLAGVELAKENNKLVLPIRPLLDGGDDVTFICDGRLAIYLAEAFLNYFTKDPTIIESACAGVAIVKTKFPFYKAYTLAEELCAEAKVKSRNTNKSFLSFYCASSTFAGTLQEIRERSHMLDTNESLYFGPYSLNQNDPDSLEGLKARIMHFQDTKNIPRNKVMKLRETLEMSDSARKILYKEIKEREHSLPESSELKTGESFFIKGKTPYYDAIDLINLYPKKLLECKP